MTHPELAATLLRRFEPDNEPSFCFGEAAVLFEDHLRAYGAAEVDWSRAEGEGRIEARGVTPQAMTLCSPTPQVALVMRQTPHGGLQLYLEWEAEERDAPRGRPMRLRRSAFSAPRWLAILLRRHYPLPQEPAPVWGERWRTEVLPWLVQVGAACVEGANA